MCLLRELAGEGVWLWLLALVTGDMWHVTRKCDMLHVTQVIFYCFYCFFIQKVQNSVEKPKKIKKGKKALRWKTCKKKIRDFIVMVTGWESQCLPHAGFFLNLVKDWEILANMEFSIFGTGHRTQSHILVKYIIQTVINLFKGKFIGFFLKSFYRLVKNRMVIGPKICEGSRTSVKF